MSCAVGRAAAAHLCRVEVHAGATICVTAHNRKMAAADCGCRDAPAGGSLPPKGPNTAVGVRRVQRNAAVAVHDEHSRALAPPRSGCKHVAARSLRT